MINKILQPLIKFYKLKPLKKIKITSLILLSGALAAFLVILLTYLAVVNGIFGKVPDTYELKNLSNAEASEVFSTDGVLLGRYYFENRTDVKYNDVSPILFNALIATEDARFYEHEGVDNISMMRVLVKSLLLGQNKGGGSTLSQQLAKNIYGRKNYGALTMPVNKMREAIIANRMEEVYSKKEILMLYLNTVSFGEDTYGIGTASMRFFSTSTVNIKAEQAVILIGMLKSPTLYNPRINPDNALQRRNVVIHQLFDNQYISERDKDSLQSLPLKLDYNKLSHSEGEATHFREHLRKKLEEWLKENPKPDGSYYNLYTDGLTIKTTIHSKLQQYAQEAVIEQIKVLQPLLDQELKHNKVFHTEARSLNKRLKSSSRFNMEIASGLSEDEALKNMLKPVQMKLITLSGEVDTLISPTDSVKISLSQLQAGFLALNPKNGYVLAWVGGASYQQDQYDHVLSKRQVGSVFKPVVYAEALKSGMQPCDYVSNQSVTYTEYNNWSPKNSGVEEANGKYSLAGALANSINTISVKLCMDVGIKNIIDLANQLGIDEKLPEVPSIALGVVETSLLKMTGAYTAFANDGIYSKPVYIEEIKNNKNQVIYKIKSIQTHVLEKDIAHNIINMMQGVVDRGTAHGLRSIYGINGDIAGKTGTTQNQKDGWFMACTPNWIAGSWVGANYPYIHFSSIRNGSGANTALPIWAKFYKKLENDSEFKNYVNQQYEFENSIDCEDFIEDNFINKLFKSKNKKDKRTGLKKKKKKRFFFRRKSKQGA